MTCVSRMKRLHGESEYLLTELVQCGYCEAAMSGGVDRRGERRGYKVWRYDRCDRKRREASLPAPISITWARIRWSSA